MRKLILSTVTLACLGLATIASSASTIRGHIHARVSEYQKNVVVYVAAIPGRTFEAPKKHVLMDQKDMEFVPHVLPILVGSTVDFLNSDNLLHNVFSPDKVADKMNLGTWPKGQKRSHTFTKLGSAVMLCQVHPEMEAFVVVLPTPYFATSGHEGSFEIRTVPAGKYTLKVWNEREWKAAPQQVTVPATGSVEVNFTLSH